MGRQAAASTTLLLVAVAVHTAFMSGLSMWLPVELRSQFGGIYPFELASYLWFPLAGGVLGALVGGALGDSASGNPKRYASVFLGSALLSGISLIAFVLGSTTLLSAVALATAASTFAAGWYGVAFATVQRLSAGQQGLVTGAMLAVASLAASLAPVALGWLRDNTEQPFLYWSGLAGFTGLLLIALHATLRDKVA